MIARSVVAASIAAIVGLAGATTHAADDPAARKILRDALDRNSAGFQSGQSTTVLQQTLQNGASKTWRTLARVQRGKDGRLRSRVTFLEPADSVGVELLMVEEADGRTAQWLWLPKTKRLRRIGGNQKDQDFMGTDFSFGDLESKSLNDGEAKKLGDEVVGGVGCAKIEVRSNLPDEVYGLVTVWIEVAKGVPRKVEFRSKDGALVKTLTAESVRDVEGRWTLDKLRMRHHVRGSTTTVETRNIDNKALFSDAIFVPESLGR